MAHKKKREQYDSDFQDWNATIREFARESERAGVILGAARLDQRLYELLTRVLVPVPGNRDDLLDQDGPLSTFSARIHAAYRLGLINPSLARALHVIRKIRNSFAHESAGATLSAGAHRDRVRELTQPFRANADFKRHWRSFADDEFQNRPESVVDFFTVLADVLIDLDVCIETTQPFEPYPDPPPSVEAPPSKRKTKKSTAPTKGQAKPA